MADTKASQLEELAYTALVADDDFVVVDASDTSMAASGTTKRTSLVDVGTWTPTDRSGAGLSFASAEGKYTRIANRVMGECIVQYPTTANSNVAAISLPFPAASVLSVNVESGGAVFWSDYGSALAVHIQTASDIFRFTVAGSITILTNANLSGKIVRWSFNYNAS